MGDAGKQCMLGARARPWESCFTAHVSHALNVVSHGENDAMLRECCQPCGIMGNVVNENMLCCE